LIPTFSPQGDGNEGPGLHRRGLYPSVDPYLFPARGRKPETINEAGLASLTG